ncbi:MAG: hypothetical protein KF777_03145 [Planctomycetaceae bacterium]|nr:hypothetical protein [Planctomycetaceae bacterium]
MPTNSIFVSKSLNHASLVVWLAAGCGLILCGCGDASSPAAKPVGGSPIEAVVVEPGRSESPAMPPQLAEAIEPLRPTGNTPAQRFRMADHRVRHDPGKLRQAGIETYSSRRLILHTDSPNPQIAKIPAMVDQLIDTLMEELGPLPLATDGSELQLTGYLIVQQDRFRNAGLIPEVLPSFDHGRHRGYEFWLNDQPTDFYREHLVFHECVHCYMTADPTLQFPAWYLEGMAELFATHVGPTEEDASIRFGVLPTSRETSPGWGRIKLIREAVDTGRSVPLAEILRFPAERFRQTDAYAWSWAICYFLNRVPATHERFHELITVPTNDFEASLLSRFGEDELALARSWEVFVRTIDYGYDLERGWFAGGDFSGTTPSSPSGGITVEAATGWQSTGIPVKRGQRLHLTAIGQVELNRTTRPWISEPRGISREYADGQPIGRLLGWICPAAPVTEWRPGRLPTFAIGDGSKVECEDDGILCLRINDHWNDLANNSGAYQVQIETGE